MSNVIYSIGTGNRELKDFIKIVAEAKLDILVDVRSRPYSKYFPHFNREFMRPIVEENGTKYIYRGKNLGGLDQNVYRDETLDEVAAWVAEGKKVAVMCSETSFKSCHRFRSGPKEVQLEPEFAIRGLTMEHLGVYRKQSSFGGGMQMGLL